MTRRGLIALLAAVTLALGAVVGYRELSQPPPDPYRTTLPPPLSSLRAEPPETIPLTDIEVSPEFQFLNLRTLGLTLRGGDFEVGRVNEVTLTTRDVTADRPGALMDLAEPRAQVARHRGLRWLIERTALDIEARRARMPLGELLLRGYRALPPPPPEQLDALRARFGGPGDEEANAAALTQWRLARWPRQRWAVLEVGLRVKEPLHSESHQEGMPRDGSEIVMRVGRRTMTHNELHQLAGMSEYTVRKEYYAYLARYFEEWTGRRILQEEAQRQGISVDELQRQAREARPVSDADLDAYLKANPDYLRKPGGRELARSHLVTIHQERAPLLVQQRLRQQARVELLMVEPRAPAIPFPAVKPLEYGAPRAPVTVVVLHAFGASDSAVLVGHALEVLFDQYGDRVRFVLLPHYQPGDALLPYRATLAMYCAQEQGQLRGYFNKLRHSYQRPHVAELMRKARQLELDERRFRACLDEDRYLPIILENRLLAERAAVDGSEPNLFVNGRIVEEPGKRATVTAAIDQALADAARPRGR